MYIYMSQKFRIEIRKNDEILILEIVETIFSTVTLFSKNFY